MKYAMKDLLTPSELIAQVRGLYVRGILTEAERGKALGRLAKRYGHRFAKPADPRAPLEQWIKANSGKTGISYVSDSDLENELAKLQKQWDESRSSDDEGHGGSPGEWMVERMGEIETERKRRAAAKESERAAAGSLGRIARIRKGK